jgi:hypothetical protein
LIEYQNQVPFLDLWLVFNLVLRILHYLVIYCFLFFVTSSISVFRRLSITIFADCCVALFGKAFKIEVMFQIVVVMCSFLLYNHSFDLIFWIVCSVKPSVWGWKIELNHGVIPDDCKTSDNLVLINSVLRSLKIDLRFKRVV